LFRVLFSEPTGRIWLREITRRTGMGFGALYHELNNFERMGLTRRKREGGAVFISINQGHPLCGALLELLSTAESIELPRDLTIQAPSRNRW
jgi:hypothetical protein